MHSLWLTESDIWAKGLLFSSKLSSSKLLPKMKEQIWQSRILETWNSNSNFKYFWVVRIEKTNLFVCFLGGEVMARQFCFKIYWLLENNLLITSGKKYLFLTWGHVFSFQYTCMILWQCYGYYYPSNNLLTLIGMSGDTFISLSFLDQILSADFFIKKF